MSLKDTLLGTPEVFNVVVEIPKGSEKKLEYNEAKDEIILDFVFKDGFRFINNYGFIPRTHTADKDTLDAFVLSSKILESGTIVVCKPIGIIKTLDRGEQDDKVLAVPIDEPERNLSEEEKEQFRKFYAEVARQKKKTIKVIGFEDKDRAIEAIKEAMV